MKNDRSILRGSSFRLLSMGLIFASVATAGGTNSYTKEMFRAGLDERIILTDSPYFVLFRLATGAGEVVVCAPASALQSAIHTQERIPFTPEGVKKVNLI